MHNCKNLKQGWGETKRTLTNDISRYKDNHAVGQRTSPVQSNLSETLTEMEAFKITKDIGDIMTLLSAVKFYNTKAVYSINI